MSPDVGAGQIWTKGDAYERYVGRWSRLVARELLAWLEVGPGARWLDVGSGTGALSETILAAAAPGAVTGIDPAEGFVDHARRQVPAATFVAGDAEALPFEDGEFDAVVSGLVLNFVPDAGRAVAEMARVCRLDGVVAAYVWDYAGEMQMMRIFWDAATKVDAGAVELDEGRRFHDFERPEGLGRLFVEAGLRSVSTRAIDVTTPFRDFDDYWEPFLGGQGPAPAYLMSLDEDRRAAVRERIRAVLPAAADGSISLIARAWAARGTA